MKDGPRSSAVTRAPSPFAPAQGMRRRLLCGMAAAPVALALPAWAHVSAARPPEGTDHPLGGTRAKQVWGSFHPGQGPDTADVRRLEFVHLHTGERLKVAYFDAGQYVPEALQALNHLLRDFRTDEVAPIDPALFDVLHRLHEATGSRRPFEVISAYRSPKTNDMLRSRSPHSGVARTSLHLRGQAIDIRLGDVALPHLREAALSLRAGGVGYYERSNFVHIDTGPVRHW